MLEASFLETLQFLLSFKTLLHNSQPVIALHVTRCGPLCLANPNDNNVFNSLPLYDLLILWSDETKKNKNIKILELEATLDELNMHQTEETWSKTFTSASSSAKSPSKELSFETRSPKPKVVFLSALDNSGDQHFSLAPNRRTLCLSSGHGNSYQCCCSVAKEVLELTVD